MAPVVSLPSLEMNLTDCKQRWADTEDSGTPSPWTEYALPDFNLKLWPPTPTPSTPTGSGHGLPHLLGQNMRTGTEWPYTAQSCLSMECPYPALAQTCGLSLSEMVPIPTASGQEGMAFPGYEDVNESAAMLASQGWSCQVTDSNTASVGGYAVGAQWPSFALPQPEGVLQSLPRSGRWADMVEDSTSQTSLEAPLSDQAREPKVVHHGAGHCRPCAWFWREQGCRNAASCGYCHMCPEGELKSRKKNKVAAMRMGALAPVKASPQAGGGWGLKLDSLIQENP